MRHSIARAAVVALAAATWLPAQARAQVADEYHNLKVLPEDITRDELLGVMRGFALGLGVRCQYCHVGEEGMPLSEFDFESDEKPTKLKARFMLEMVGYLNVERLPRLSQVAEYRAVREQFYGRGSYDFGELPLLITAGGLMQGGRTDDALALVDLNLEYYPESVTSMMLMAQLYAARGDRDLAIEALEKVLDLQPENMRATRMLARIRAAGGGE